MAYRLEKQDGSTLKPFDLRSKEKPYRKLLFYFRTTTSGANRYTGKPASCPYYRTVTRFHTGFPYDLMGHTKAYGQKEIVP